MPKESEAVVNVALLPDTAPVPSVVVPSLKLTVPVAVPLPVAIVAVNVTDWPMLLGLAEEVIDVVVIAVPIVPLVACVAVCAVGLVLSVTLMV
jgi:hypothetical protein